ncbi:MAG TPA: DHHA1 domain-containing protein, partial [Rhodocyclaceae bacterium]|nr:DHHA1 domain-containing protein [Rhodocyclaceae bacterium]
QRIRRGRLQPGLRALFAVAGKDPARASATDLGFMIGPRVNAAGRLTDMRVGIECLLAEDYGQALALARELDQLNRARREMVADREAPAEALRARIDPGERASLCLFQPDWHAGVVGLIAGRVKERFNRPTIAFAPGQGDEIKGSGRSIPGLHLRDALDRVAKREPDLLQRFGGHAMAAGLSLRATDYPRFVEAFETAVQDMLDPAALESRLETDGALEEGYYNLPTARLLDEPVWGQGFPAPLFADRFEV